MNSRSPAPTNRAANDNVERVAVLTLLRSRALSPSKLVAALEAFGSARPMLIDAINTGHIDLPTGPVSAPVTVEDVVANVDDLSSWEEKGWRVVAATESSYPDSLRGVFNRPAMLWVAGEFESLVRQPIVAVVGSRAASPEGVRRARSLAGDLAANGITVASGLAVGIDAAAHSGALDAGGVTFAVMGTGLDKRYPAENAPLAERILAGHGALVSQFMPDQGPTKWSFPVRNITMSGLSLATVVIEASASSGAKMQAEAALRHGRPVILPRSLVSSHQWAFDMVERGFHGVSAVVAEHFTDIAPMIQPMIQGAVSDAVPAFA